MQEIFNSVSENGDSQMNRNAKTEHLNKGASIYTRTCTIAICYIYM